MQITCTVECWWRPDTEERYFNERVEPTVQRLSGILLVVVYEVEFLYNVELCPHDTRFLWYTGSVHIHLHIIYMQTKRKPTA
jgi:hypothetical protein